MALDRPLPRLGLTTRLTTLLDRDPVPLRAPPAPPTSQDGEDQGRKNGSKLTTQPPIIRFSLAVIVAPPAMARIGIEF